MKPLTSWIGRALSGPKGDPSAARLGYFVFVVMGALWLSYDLVMSLTSLKKSGITSEWVMAFGIYASTTTAGYIGGKVAGRPGAGAAGAPDRSSSAGMPAMDGGGA